jgi:hypothetical protein
MKQVEAFSAWLHAEGIEHDAEKISHLRSVLLGKAMALLSEDNQSASATVTVHQTAVRGFDEEDQIYRVPTPKGEKLVWD